MGGSECCVENCDSSSHDHRGRKLLNGLTFHCFPAWRTNEGGQISELTKRRRDAWVAAVGRNHITFERIPSSMSVLPTFSVRDERSSLFTSTDARQLSPASPHTSRRLNSSPLDPGHLSVVQNGRPAYEMLDSDPDWVPSLHLGQDDEGHSGKKRRSSSTERPAEGLGKPAPPPWREVKLALQSVLGPRPGGETRERPAVKRVDVGFRDFFRNALEASLEASIWSRAQFKNQPEVGFKLPPLDGEPPTHQESWSSSCSNCSRLLRRIQKLERSLFQLASRQVDVERLETWLQPDQNPQSSEEENLLMLHGSSAEVLQDVGLDSEMAPISPDSALSAWDELDSAVV